MKKILFVCTGNICRSSSAEAVLRNMVVQQSRFADFEIDSAGTHSYHVGEPSDGRAVEHASRRGINMHNIRARQVRITDFNKFDLIVAMDRGHLSQLKSLMPEESVSSLKLFTDFMAVPTVKDVPDPYYGDSDGFETVLDMLEEGCAAILETL
mgnify:FL=1|tara:strand:- start:67 stop:525 length:459 start_codon:yes stop_codon:yes gene_type:complete